MAGEKPFDRVKESTPTTGTAAFALAGAEAGGYHAFGDRLVDQDKCFYVCQNRLVGEWEVGSGTYNASANTLSRTQVFDGSAGASLVPFSAGVKDLALSPPPADRLRKTPYLDQPNVFTVTQTVPALVVSGLTGATAASRYVGGTLSGAPATGNFAAGDFVVDQGGKFWICTAAGSPGTWAAGGGGVNSFNGRTGTVTLTTLDVTTALGDPNIAYTDVGNVFTLPQTVLALAASGLTGATAASRYVGGTATGAPTTGTFAVGDFVVDRSGALWICTAAGTPGTWAAAGGGSGGTVTLTGDVTGSGSGSFTTTIAAGAVTYAKVQNVSATARVLGRKSVGAGSAEECTLSDVLDFVGSAAQGDLMVRGAATWTRLGAGAAGQFLKTQGAGANPVWAVATGGVTSFNTRTGAVSLTALDVTTALGNPNIAFTNLGNIFTAPQTFPQTGLLIQSATVSNTLTIASAEALTADRTLSVDTGDADRALTLNGDTTLSGVNTGDQMITLQGNVTGTGMGTFTATIAPGAVTYARMQNVSATARVLGRKTAGAGSPEECTFSDVLDFVGSAAQGDVFYRGAATWTRLAAGTSGAFLQTQGVGANPLWATQTITLTGDVTGAGVGSFTTTVTNGAVTYAKMQNVSATSRVLGRKSAGAGSPEECTASDVLNMIAGTGQGDILYRDAATWNRLAAGTTGYFLKTQGPGANPIWDVASSASVTTLTGDVTGSGSGTFATTIAAAAVTYAKLQNVTATARLLGRKTAGAGSPEECTLSQVLDFVGSAAQGDLLYRDASTWNRLGAGTSGLFLKTLGAGANPIWDVPAGGGGSSNVLGLATKTANYTVASTDGVLLLNAAGGAFTVTLPTAVGRTGMYFVLKKIDSTATPVTLATTSSQTIDGQATYVLNVPNTAVTLVSNNANWFII